MFAVVETGGKQIKAVPGRYIDIEKIPQAEGEKVSLSNVLMLISGKDSKTGNPYIKGAAVNGKVLEKAKDDKVIVYKMRPKKGTRKKYGHRQWYSRIFVESIELDGKVLSQAEKKQKTVKKEEAVSEDTVKAKVKAGLKPASSKKKS